MMTDLLIRGGSVMDDAGGRRADVLVRGRDIAAVGEDIDVAGKAQVLDAGGCMVAPGLVDLHCHLREPGGEIAETIETGSRAAALGGYTAIVAMPNTEPALDHPSVVRDVLALGRSALAEVAVAAAITVGRRGEKLVPMAELAALGVKLFTDYGRGVQDAAVLRRALEYASDLSVVLAEHCEDEELAAGGQMHEGVWSSRLGLPGQPAVAEEAMLSRDLALVRLTGSPMHFLHLSSAGSVDLLRRAKAGGLPVTAEVTPHHLCFTDASVAGYDPVFKVNPPLREQADVDAVRAGLIEGVIDAIATDHAPHAAETKEKPFDSAPSGMIGLETALAVSHSLLTAGPPEWPLRDLLGVLSGRPARIAGLDRASGGRHGGPVEEGGPANLVVFDPACEWSVQPDLLSSRSRNTPFRGMSLHGRVRHTVLEGEVIVMDGAAQR